MSTLGLILVVVLVIVLLGGLGGGTYIHQWPYGYGFNHGGVGLPGLLLIIVVIAILTGYI